MLEAMIAGQRDPKALAALAYGRMRAKLSRLGEALTGHFPDHHALSAAMMLDRVDAITPRIASSPPGSRADRPLRPAGGAAG